MRSECFKPRCCHERARQRRSKRGYVLNRLSVIGTLVLAGCSLAPFITKNSIDYNSTVENVTNSVLVTNILRARDGAPLYFSDLSQIRGSLALNVQTAETTLPYGPLFPASAGASAQAGPIAINSTPGFDVAPLNTKNFAQGMMEGIDVNVFAYFIQRGIDAKVFLNLVVGRVERYSKTPDGGYRLDATCASYSRNCFPGLVKAWTVRRPIMGQLSEVTKLGPPIPAELLIHQHDPLGSLIKVDAGDYDLKEAKNSFQLSKTNSKSVLCVASRNGGYEAVGIASPGAAKEPKKPPVPKTDGSCLNVNSAGMPTKDAAGGSSPYRYVLYTRSVEAVFYYLGGLLKDPANSPIPFYISDSPLEPARFHVDYRGKSYFVREATDDGSDATITILAILNDLLNLNRDAKDIPSTKTVATTP
jgi:hypothetical protein